MVISHLVNKADKSRFFKKFAKSVENFLQRFCYILNVDYREIS